MTSQQTRIHYNAFNHFYYVAFNTPPLTKTKVLIL